MGAGVRRAKRAVTNAGELPRYRVPQHWMRQLGGTLAAQLGPLQVDVERNALAASLSGNGLNSTDRAVWAALKMAARPMRPREIEETIDQGRASVNVALQRLERCGIAKRAALPNVRNMPAFEWSVTA